MSCDTFSHGEIEMASFIVGHFFQFWFVSPWYRPGPFLFLHILRLFRQIPLCSRQFPYFTKSKSQFSWNFGFLESLVSFKIIKQINIRLLNRIKRIHQEGEISLDISHKNGGSIKQLMVTKIRFNIRVAVLLLF